MNLQDVSHIHIPDGDVRMIHDSDNRLLWGAVGYNVLFSGNTFQQSYEGKNMFNKANPPSTILDASASELETGLRITQTAAGQWKGCIFVLGKASDVAGQTINVHAIATKSASNLPFCHVSLCDASGGNRVIIKKSDSSEIDIAAVMPDNPSRGYYCIALLSNGSGTGNRGDYIDYEELMVYLGSTVTSYEPFVGGQPSPSPDYSQQIQTVTGTQTISINGTNYPISLGSLELCKLGTYQDYIYKDGDDWKVHKKTKSVTLDENDDWIKREYGTNAYHVIRPDISTARSKICIASQYFRGVSYNDRQNNQSNIIFADSTAGMAVDTRGITIRNTPWSDLSSFLSWISGKAIECLYVLLESTDTTITDQTLIAQLEAIYNLVRRYGYNFVVSASGNNLPIIIDRTLL